MKVYIRVQPGARRNHIKQEGDQYKVYLTAPPIHGRANKALIDILADYFNTKRSCIQILKGHHTKDKIVEIR